MAALTRHDTFCWDCCVENTTLKCSNCPRSFHPKCARSKKRNDCETWRCPICIELDATKNTDDKECLDMLPIMINRVLNDEKFASLKVPLKGAKPDCLVNLIDLTKINDKIYSYTSFFEFLTDIQCIVHNCLILFSDKHDMVKTAKSLEEYLEHEIKSVKKCIECYSNANKHPTNWSTMVCAKPHLVLWAKVIGYNYWPGKCMKVEGDMVNVRFFGDYTEADVLATNCFLYSKTNPSVKSIKPSDRYKLALKDADKYIQNIRKTFGSYKLAETKTPFDPTLLNQYLLDSIPGAGSSPIVSKGITDGSSDALINALEDQIHSDADSSTLPRDVSMNKSTSIDSTQANAATEVNSKDNPSDSTDSLNPKSEHIKQIEEQVRFPDDNDGEVTQKKFDNDSNIEINIDSINRALDEDSMEYCHIPVVQPVDAEITTETWNLSKCREVMAESTKAFECVCDLNAKLQDEMKNLVAKYDRQITDLEQRNQQMIAIQDENERSAKKLIDDLMLKICQLEIEKSEYDKMMLVHNEMIVRKDEERMKAVSEANKLCEENYACRLEANKKLKFCVACDASKPQDTFYVCSPECQTRYWMQMDQ
ncbi:MYND-type zinc finger-containing chromatin reader ZMYND8-like [Sitodiplosis mosellana]|uniref:MYND-type zinc finger-containing chromatin reader ZMYND8-like n=1 Tax=Sitodiplosis mosellana TaxID=263140 RepID=UPI002444AF25|nr:MYND-type zinc finger-containing chromatin reader ZMYND8-like [Sitodiplosis mosellana]